MMMMMMVQTSATGVRARGGHWFNFWPTYHRVSLRHLCLL